MHFLGVFSVVPWINVGLWDLQNDCILYLHFTQCHNFLGIGVVIRNCDILYILGDSWPYLFLGHRLVFNEKKNQIYRHVEQTLKREKL